LKQWAEQFDLPFTLLSDPDHVIHEKYGAWGEKNMYGKMVTGVIRTTVVMDENKKVTAIFPKVNVKGHVAKVLEALTGAE
jgi:peroxiredoxin Q/BCP